MIRWLLALLLALPPPALAADWGHYVNPRFGYAIDIPPGFVGQGESDNGDGEVFKTPTAALTVFGRYLLSDIDSDFEDAVGTEQQFEKQDGWSITYAVSTPQSASYSGTKGGRILYTRMIALCGPAIATFDFEYSTTDLQKFANTVDRLVRSLKSTIGSVACLAK